MEDIFVNIGELSINKDPNKAAKKYADTAKAALRKGMQRAIKNSAGFTTEKTATTTSGFTVNLKVSEIAVGTGSVTCKLTGELLKWPKPEMISTSLSGGGRVDGGTSDAAIADCIDSVAEEMMKGRVLPVIKRLVAP